MSINKALLESLGIGITEFSDLLLISSKTIESWFHRQTFIPALHSEFLTARFAYAEKPPFSKYPFIGVRWEIRASE